MSFYVYDISFLIIFGTFLAIFLIKRRKKLQREGILILYRTKLGIRIINYLSKKYRKVLKFLEPLIIFTGYALMLGMLLLLFQLVYIFIKFPAFIRTVRIPPLMPLIPYLPKIFNIDFLPPFFFTYWIIVLAIAAISHEFSHGIFARAKGVKIKSTGFAFLGPFLAAFVEPDENKVKRLKIRDQLPFLSAGTFANVIMTVLFFLILWLFFVSAFVPSGVVFNTYTFSVVNVSDVRLGEKKLNIVLNGGLNLTEVFVDDEVFYIDDNSIENLEKEKEIMVFEDAPALRAGLAGVIIEFGGKEIKDNEELRNVLFSKKPKDKVKIKTLLNDEIEEFEVELGERPDDESKAYLGISLIRTDGLSVLSKIRTRVLFFKDPNTYYKPKLADDFIVFIYNLLWWIVLINFSVALVNMLPIGIFDGGRVFYLTALGLTKSEKKAKKAYKASTYFILFIFLLLMLLWFFNFVM